MADIFGLSETDASNTSLSGISVAEGCPPSNVNDALRALAGMLKRDWDKKGPTKASAGTNTITLTLDTAPGGYVQGEVISFVAGGTNTGAATLNINGLGAKNVTKNGTTALQGGEIVAGAIIVVMYDGTQFQLISNNQREDAALWGGTSSGTNTVTLSLTPAPGAYYAGMEVIFKAGGTNTGATTLNVNSLGTKNVFVANAACGGGEIVANQLYSVVYDGTQFQLISPQSTQRGALIGVQIFSTPGTSTYTPTVGANTYVAEVQGAGGGGGGCATTAAAQCAVGGPGGGGGYALKRGLTSAISGATITVGAKGTGGAAGANNGTAGGTSSIGGIVSATGGGLGSGGVAQGVPVDKVTGSAGNGSGGDINVPGYPGVNTTSWASTNIFAGTGGSSRFGSGAVQGSTGSGVAGTNATGRGGGGMGGMNTASQGTGKAGGDGTDGLVIIWEYA